MKTLMCVRYCVGAGEHSGKEQKYGFTNKLDQMADMVLPFVGLARWFCR